MRGAVVIVLALIANACSSSVDVDDLRGTYRAIRVNGKAPPTSVIGDEGHEIKSGRLELVFPDSMLLLLEEDFGVDTLSARYTFSGAELLLTDINAFPKTMGDRVIVRSSRSVVLTVIYHYAPSSGLPPNWPVEIVFWK